MNKTINQVLVLLDNATDPQYSAEISLRKSNIAQTLALVAVAEELERMNDLKEKEFKIKGLE